MKAARCLVLVAVLPLLWISCRSSTDPTRISASGTIEATQTDVSTQIAGQVNAVRVHEGQSVQKGQILVEIEHAKLDAQQQQAEANVAMAKVRLEQAKLIAGLTTTQTQTQIDQAKALFDVATSHLSQAETGQQLQQTATQTQIDQAEAALEQAQARLTQAEKLHVVQQSQTESQIQQAKAALKIAQSRLALLESGAREQEIQVAGNSVAQAKANLDHAKSAWERTQRLYAGQVLSQEQNDLAQFQFDIAQAQYQTALEQKDLIQDGAREEDKEAARAQIDQAQAAYDMAQAASLQNEVRARDIQIAQEAAQQAQAALTLAKANALQGQLREQDVAAAKAGVEQASAALRLAQANTVQPQIQAQNVRLAELQLDAAQENLRLIQLQIDDATVVAPMNGVVATRIVEEGELASPGRALIRLIDLDTVHLNIYIPETRLGHVKLGQKAKVQTDSFPGRLLEGSVVYISPEAEFTPKNIQTKEERVKLVYRVKIELTNPDQALKPGMPADAWLMTDNADHGDVN